MSALGAQIFALLGLRALAEYDYPEYSRATELSKAELDSQLEQLLDEAQMDDERTAEEARAASAQFEQLKNDLRGRQEADFLLRQMHASWLQRAQQLSLAFVKSGDGRGIGTTRRTAEHGLTAVTDRTPTVADDYLRLGVMLLMQSLPGYEALFDYPLQGKLVDCVLRPTSEGGPVVLIEGKQRLLSARQLEGAAEQLLKFAKAWGGDTYTAILTTPMANGLRADFDGERRGRGQRRNLRSTTFVLEFDVENNFFIGKGAGLLLGAIHEAIAMLQ
jgi:hypothetical protein